MYVTDTPVIEIRDLHKAYGALEVLKGVDITAQGGQVISLIGSSGSGKSTLLRCCNLLEDSQQGTIRFKGEDVSWKGSDHARRPSDARQVLRIRTNLSMVFQQFNLWAHMTILQNVMEAPVTVLRAPGCGPELIRMDSQALAQTCWRRTRSSRPCSWACASRKLEWDGFGQNGDGATEISTGSGVECPRQD